MEFSKLACLYYPTTVILIDDDPAFLKSIAFRLDPRIPYKMFTNPEEALAFLKTLKNQNKFLSHSIVSDDEDTELENKYAIQFNKIYQEVYNHNIYKEVSIVIADHAMPQMTGAELFEAIQDLQVMKVMLTGQADEAFAVKLFNAKMINRFILKKSDRLLAEMINNSVKELLREYFYDLSDIVIKSLSLGREHTCLLDPVFIKFFYDLKNKLSASSYYLLESSGSFIFFNDDANPTWLLVKTKDEMVEFARQAEAEDASQEVIDALKNGDKIAHFNNFDEYTDAVENGHWENHLYPAQKLNGEQEYRYAIIKDLRGFPLDRKKILSFDEFLHGDKA